jgi:hypothetical protein
LMDTPGMPADAPCADESREAQSLFTMRRPIFRM